MDFTSALAAYSFGPAWSCRGCGGRSRGWAGRAVTGRRCWGTAKLALCLTAVLAAGGLTAVTGAEDAALAAASGRSRGSCRSRRRC